MDPTDDYNILVAARQQAGFPPIQQCVRLINRRNTCYANSGINLLLSSPEVSFFMYHLPATVHQLLGDLQVQSAAPPGGEGDLYNLRDSVATLVPAGEKFRDGTTQQDASEWLFTLFLALDKVLVGNLKQQFNNLFSIGIDVKYECCSEGHEEPAQTEYHRILKLSVLSSTT